ncbi:MAG: Rid family hydrolase [Cyanobacteria bacterium P01_A01_bin.15]
MQFINPSTLNDPSSYGFTQIVAIPVGTSLAYIAGQGGGTTDGRGYSDSFSDQVDQAFANLRTALAAVGAAPEDVVKITVLSVDHTDEKLRLISAARNSFWPNQKPASTLIPVPRLASAGMLFEIDAMTVIPQ